MSSQQIKRVLYAVYVAITFRSMHSRIFFRFQIRKERKGHISFCFALDEEMVIRLIRLISSNMKHFDVTNHTHFSKTDDCNL